MPLWEGSNFEGKGDIEETDGKSQRCSNFKKVFFQNEGSEVDWKWREKTD